MATTQHSSSEPSRDLSEPVDPDLGELEGDKRSDVSSSSDGGSPTPQPVPSPSLASSRPVTPEYSLEEDPATTTPRTPQNPVKRVKFGRFIESEPQPSSSIAGRKRNNDSAQQQFENEKSAKVDAQSFAPHLTPKKVLRNPRLTKSDQFAFRWSLQPDSEEPPLSRKAKGKMPLSSTSASADEADNVKRGAPSPSRNRRKVHATEISAQQPQQPRVHSWPPQAQPQSPQPPQAQPQPPQAQPQPPQAQPQPPQAQPQPPQAQPQPRYPQPQPPYAQPQPQYAQPQQLYAQPQPQAHAPLPYAHPQQQYAQPQPPQAPAPPLYAPPYAQLQPYAPQQQSYAHPVPYNHADAYALPEPYAHAERFARPGPYQPGLPYVPPPYAAPPQDGRYPYIPPPAQEPLTGPGMPGAGVQLVVNNGHPNAFNIRSQQQHDNPANRKSRNHAPLAPFPLADNDDDMEGFQQSPGEDESPTANAEEPMEEDLDHEPWNGISERECAMDMRRGSRGDSPSIHVDDHTDEDVLNVEQLIGEATAMNQEMHENEAAIDHADEAAVLSDHQQHRADRHVARRPAPRPGPSTQSNRGSQGVPSNFAVMLLDRMQQLNDSMQERDLQNREFQNLILGSVKKLERKISEVQYTAPVLARRHARSLSSRQRPPRGMSSRVVLDPSVATSSSTSATDKAKLALLEKRHLTKLQKVVRDHLHTLLRFEAKDYKAMAQLHPPLTDAEIEEYKNDSAPDYFARREFRVDFMRPWAGFDFNIEARDYFVRHLLRDFKGGGYKNAGVPERYITYEHIGAALDTYMETCRSQYRKVVLPQDQATLDRRKERMRQNSRKHTSFITRQELLTKKGWDRHLALFARLKAEHMSGDETDRDEGGKKIHPPSFTVTEAEWPSKKYKGLMRKLGQWQNEDWKNPTLDGDYKGGSGPRQRHYVGKIVSAPAPKGLWRNCYSKRWKAKLKPHQLRALEMVDEDYDFTLPDIDGGADDGDESMGSDDG